MKYFYDIWLIFKKELQTIAADSGVWIFFIILNLAYPIIYTYIYSNEIVHEVPAAVVDNSHSSLSREYIRRWNASPNVNVISKCADMEEAKKLLYKKKIYGILEIPSSFSEDISTGKQAHLSLYADMGGLLNYKALLLAANDVTGMMGAGIKVKGMQYASSKQQEIKAAPVKSMEVKMFNPQSGYASFIMPAILILVIQQSLLLGVGTLAGTARDRNKNKMDIPCTTLYRNPIKIVWGKALAYLSIYLFMVIWVFIVVPGIFNLTRTGFKLDMFLFLVPFLLCCAFMAIAASFIIKEREESFILFIFTSVPLMFMSGVSWPIESVPSYLAAFAKIFPSTYGIQGSSKLFNMGAGLEDILSPFYHLWILAGGYFLLSCYLYHRQIKKGCPVVQE